MRGECEEKRGKASQPADRLREWSRNDGVKRVRIRLLNALEAPKGRDRPEVLSIALRSAKAEEKASARAMKGARGKAVTKRLTKPNWRVKLRSAHRERGEQGVRGGVGVGARERGGSSFLSE